MAFYAMATVEQLMELESLGISPNKTNQFNDELEISWLIELLKEHLFQLYQEVYNSNSTAEPRAKLH